MLNSSYTLTDKVTDKVTEREEWEGFPAILEVT